jgi:hypothetical protein
MTHPEDGRPRLDDEEREFVERVARHYGPTSMTPAEQVAFDAGLRARLERPHRRPLLVPALATVAAAGLVLLTLFRALGPSGPEWGQPRQHLANGWEYELLLASEVSASEDRDESTMLPEEYVAIASVFLAP